ncbi:pyridoxine/pyridoxamine 5'-phosphate oxidase [Frondihabitans cladoniiphilus]|uniref:Pyridoxal 5'-phosphate synthase n=1 Tax=Frondihabitans cladoniiphilus TaxID=715785 RepID=A0ABP8VKX8_9MICO
MTDHAVPSIRSLLHDAARPANDAPAFDPAEAPADPMALLTQWIRAAAEGGAVQPQAATLSTATADGGAQARTLLLKDVSDGALWFATSSLSPKGRQMTEDPRIALTFYWREQGRQIRVVGRAAPGPRDVSVADFTSRHPDSRAGAIAQPQSSVVTSPGDARAHLDAAKARIAADDSFAPDDWTAYRVDPTAVEFWQATTGHDQVRLGYSRPTVDGGWTRAELWP